MDDSAFWRFSLALYSKPGVPEAALRLQDERGVDVNVMLYLLFLARNGRKLDAPDLDCIEAVAAEWRETVVRPLREVRRRLKTRLGAFEPATTAELRNSVKRIELESERLQQLTMERTAAAASLGSGGNEPHACARDNLALYAARLGEFPAAPLKAILERFAETAP